MKHEVIGRVKVHQLIEGEKPATDDDRIRVRIMLRSDESGASGDMLVMTMPAKVALAKFPLGSVITNLSMEAQLSLWRSEADEEAERQRRPHKDPAQTSMGLSRGDSPIAAPPAGAGESLARDAVRHRGKITPIGKRGGRGKGAATPSPGVN